jgi:hypothetical protein
MRALRLMVVAAGVVAFGNGLMRAADYPLSLSMDAQAKKGSTTITSTLTIRVDRLMDEAARTRVSNALKFGGFTNFLNNLRPLPVVGSVELDSRKVELRYAHEQADDKGRRLVLIADQPLFFLAGDPDKTRTGYQLTLLELRFDAQGRATGTMAGAARVKPAPDGSVIPDDFGEAPIQLTPHTTRP